MSLHIAKCLITEDATYYFGLNGRLIETINKDEYLLGYGYHMLHFGYYMGYQPQTDIIYILWYFDNADVCDILDHEYTHKVLNKLEGFEASQKFDNIEVNQ